MANLLDKLRQLINKAKGAPTQEALTSEDVLAVEDMVRHSKEEAEHDKEFLEELARTDVTFFTKAEEPKDFADFERRLDEVEHRAAMPDLPDHTHPQMLDDGCWAVLGGHIKADATAQNRWNYAWQEVYQIERADAAAVFFLLDGGRSGTTTVMPARNSAEDGQPQVYKVTGPGLTDLAAVPSLESPNGLYFENGAYGGKPAYERTDGVFWLWWDTVSSTWLLSAAKGDKDPIWTSTGSAIVDTYAATISVTGTPTVALADMPATPDGTVVWMRFEVVDGNVQPVFHHAPFYGQVLGDAVWTNSGGGHIQTTSDPSDVAFTIGGTNTTTSRTILRAVTLDACRHPLKFLVGTEGGCGGTWYAVNP